MEYLLGEACGRSTQNDVGKISRLFIAGNSISEGTPLAAQDELPDKKASKKYGYDASAYNPAPTAHLDNFLANLLPSIPITLLPGESDPANVSLPQQPIHPAMFPRSRAYSAIPGSGEPGWFDSVTNPWEGDVDGWRMMGTGGQPIDDIYKYVDGDERLEMMENLLRWRCGAPTAPDTLCKSSVPTLHCYNKDNHREHTLIDQTFPSRVQGATLSRTRTLLSSMSVHTSTSLATNPNSSPRSSKGQPGKLFA